MSDRIPVILNPAARSTQAAAREKLLRELDPEPEVIITSFPGEATKIATELAQQGRELIVAAGGDGTMNEVLQGICQVNSTHSTGQPHTALGVLPLGTMNVFSLELGLPSSDLTACWKVLSSGKRRQIDLWKANEHYFVQLAGVGLDAEIIQETPWERKKKLGPLSYVISAAQVLRRQPPLLRVSIPGRPDLVGSVVLIGAGKHYGGPVTVFPKAELNDGLLDLLFFQGLGSWEILQMVRALLERGYEHALDLDYLQVPELTVHGTPAAPFELDGELIHETTPVHFRAAPFPLTIAG